MIKGFENVTKRMIERHKKKNEEFASDEDPYRNFKAAEIYGIATAEKTMLVGINNNLSKITNMLNKNAPIDDKDILDIAIYAVDLICYLEEKSGKTPTPVTPTIDSLKKVDSDWRQQI